MKDGDGRDTQGWEVTLRGDELLRGCIGLSGGGLLTTRLRVDRHMQSITAEQRTRSYQCHAPLTTTRTATRQASPRRRTTNMENTPQDREHRHWPNEDRY
jgi:hypothetical protein